MASAALFPPLARGYFGDRPRPLGLDLVRASAPPPFSSPAGCRSRSACVRARPRCSRSSAATTGWRSLLAVLCPIGQPGRRPVPRRWPAWRSRSRRGATAQAARGHRDRRGRVHPAGVPLVGVPGGRLGALPDHRLPADPAVRARCVLVLPREKARSAGAPRSTASARRSRSRSRRRWAATPCDSAPCSAARCSCARSGAGRGPGAGGRCRSRAPALPAAGASLEGKEVRFGVPVLRPSFVRTRPR